MTARTFLNGRAVVHHGDCRDVLRTLADASIDAIVTDPPYALTTSGSARGFMGSRWDTGDTAFAVDFWQEALRVLKPGGHVVAFGGTRTYHRLAVAIEDAGFEIRDQLGWLYGTGFPKSLDVSKAIDKAAGAEREVIGINPNHRAESGVAYEGMYAGGNTGAKDITAPATAEAAQWQGWGTALKPAWEPIVLARKPLIGTVATNVLTHGTGAINVDGCRIPAPDGVPTHVQRGEPSNGILGGGLNGSNRDGGRIETRWPANIVHDGSPEVEAAFAEFGDRKSGARKAGTHQPLGMYANAIGEAGKRPEGMEVEMPELAGSSGSASRFFYCAKASRADRAGSKHPTVKPLALMRWLIRLVTPPGGTVLDPFAGSGTTLQAAIEESFGAIGVEREAEFFADSCGRLSAEKPSEETALAADEEALL